MAEIAPERRDGALTELVTIRSPRSVAADAYRTLRTNLRFAGVDRPLRSLLVTSAGPGEGKTTVVANLGVAMAESGSRVVLVDCDLRQPGLHRACGLPLAPGLIGSLMEDSTELPLRSTAVPGLLVLTAGGVPPNPAEFVASERLGQLIIRLRGEVDFVLIDSPPAGIVPDAALLASHVDGVVLVVSAGRTKRDLARRAREQLDAAGARLVGAVLNNAKLDRRVLEYYGSQG